MLYKTLLRTILITIVIVGTIYAQFRTGVTINPRPDYSERYLGEHLDDEPIPQKFSHHQQFSTSFMYVMGQPLSVNSYTNIFTYQIREDLTADAKVNWFYLMGPYADLWGSDILGRPTWAWTRDLSILL